MERTDVSLNLPLNVEINSFIIIGDRTESMCLMHMHEDQYESYETEGF